MKLLILTIITSFLFFETIDISPLFNWFNQNISEKIIVEYQTIELARKHCTSKIIHIIQTEEKEYQILCNF